MALTLTLLAVNRGPGSPWVEVYALVTPSGSYVAGGDTLDLTQLYTQTDPTGHTLDSDQLPIEMDAAGNASLAGNSKPVYFPCAYLNPNSTTALATALTPKTCLMQFFAGVTEATGAYSAPYLGDQIILHAVFLGQR